MVFGRSRLLSQRLMIWLPRRGKETKIYFMSKVDLEKYRLRRFVNRLIEMGEVEIHDKPVPLAALSAIIEASEQAHLFRKAGPEQVELVAKTAGSRTRLAAAF